MQGPLEWSYAQEVVGSGQSQVGTHALLLVSKRGSEETVFCDLGPEEG